MNKFNDRTGEVFIFENGENMEIIEYFRESNITVKFSDGTIVKKCRFYDFRLGNIKNKNTPNVYGLGFFGYGEYNFNEYKNIYKVWYGMFKRCYNISYLKNNPTYDGCFVVAEWHDFQNFAKWAVKNYVEGFELDKDILVKGNKIYGPETCCFVPHEVNVVINKKINGKGIYPTGVHKSRGNYISRISVNGVRKYLGDFNNPTDAFLMYKKHKIIYLTEMANKYKNVISEKCYKALINRSIEIND